MFCPLYIVLFIYPEKTAYISRRHHGFSRKMTSEERLLKCYTDDVLLPRSGQCFWLVEAHFPRGSTNQYYLDLSSDTSSVWNICPRFSDVISRGNQWWRREMSAVFLGYCLFRQNADLLSVLVNYEHIPPKVDLDY